jgi:disulfide bond formation protein DsbB
MKTETVTLLFAMLAVACQFLVAGLAVAWVASRNGGPAAGWRARMLDRWGADANSLAVLIAAVATGGSLYLSEVANFPPCRLCWVQRAFMYPLALVLFAAGRRASVRLHWLGLGMATLGGLVSIWHVLIERFPSLESGATCDPANPCSIKWVEHFGYLTIPAMALSAFAAIVALTIVALRHGDPDPVLPDDEETGIPQETR